MTGTGDAALDTTLRSLLDLQVAPMAMTFPEQAPPNSGPYGSPRPHPTLDGRIGRVPAGCALWLYTTPHPFTTVTVDCGHCHVGRGTHGFNTLKDVRSYADVVAFLESGGVTMNSTR